jgi:hypothetical protein
VAHRGDGADAIAFLEARAGLRAEPCGQLDLERTGLRAHLDREAGLAQHLEHPVVLRVHPRDERRDPGSLGELGEVRQQDGGDPVALPCIGDRERQLGAIAGLPDEACMGDDLVLRAGDGDQPGAGLDQLGRGAVDVHAEAEEAEPARLLRQTAQEAGDAVDIARRGGSQVDRGAVAQDHVAAALTRDLGLLADRGGVHGHRR